MSETHLKRVLFIELSIVKVEYKNIVMLYIIQLG